MCPRSRSIASRWALFLHAACRGSWLYASGSSSVRRPSRSPGVVSPCPPGPGTSLPSAVEGIRCPPWCAASSSTHKQLHPLRLVPAACCVDGKVWSWDIPREVRYLIWEKNTGCILQPREFEPQRLHKGGGASGARGNPMEGDGEWAILQFWSPKNAREQKDNTILAAQQCAPKQCSSLFPIRQKGVSDQRMGVVDVAKGSKVVTWFFAPMGRKLAWW